MSAKKHSPKDIHLTGLKHAKEVICVLLDQQAEIVAALSKLLNDPTIPLSKDAGDLIRETMRIVE